MTKASCGLSQPHAEQYCNMLTSDKYKKDNKELWVELATLARSIATKILDPKTLEAIVPCRLIPLDKKHEVHPTSIRDVVKSIIEVKLSLLSDASLGAANRFSTSCWATSNSNSLTRKCRRLHLFHEINL